MTSLSPQQANTRTSRDQINDVLDDLLEAVPRSILVHVGEIHSTPDSVNSNQISLFVWDMIYARASPNYTKGPGRLTTGQPLVLWSDYIGDLLADKCQYRLKNDISHPYTRQQMEVLGIYSVDICPIKNPNNTLLGAIFISWSEPRTVIERESVMPRIRLAADRIGRLINQNRSIIEDYRSK